MKTMMSRTKFIITCCLVLVFNATGFSQQYWIERLSNEGVRLNGKPIHPTAKRIYCSENDFVELACDAQCVIRRTPKGVAWLGSCCYDCCSKTGKIRIGDAFQKRIQKHINNKHKEDHSPIAGCIVPKDDISTNVFYNYLGNCPIMDSLIKYEFVEGIIDSVSELVQFRIIEDTTNCRRLMIKNNSEDIVYAVSYYTAEGDTINRSNLIPIPWNGGEKVLIDIKNDVSQTFYVFYSFGKDGYNDYYDCLSDDTPIKCQKIISHVKKQ